MITSNKFYVYSVTNNLNGQRYIGFTKHPDSRWSEHCKPGFAGRPITDAIMEFKKKNFEFKIIGTYDTEAIARAVEAALINTVGTLYPCGYNLRVTNSPKIKYTSKYAGFKSERWTDASRANHSIRMTEYHAKRKLTPTK